MQHQGQQGKTRPFSDAQKNIGLEYLYTLPETHIAPENGPSQREASIPTIHFQGLC